MDLQNELSTVIRRGRERKGLTQEELSQIIHKSDKYIGAVECGRIMPPYAVLKQIVQVLEIDGNTLFYENANEGAGKNGRHLFTENGSNYAETCYRTFANYG